MHIERPLVMTASLMLSFLNLMRRETLWSCFLGYSVQSLFGVIGLSDACGRAVGAVKNQNGVPFFALGPPPIRKYKSKEVSFLAHGLCGSEEGGVVVLLF